MSNNDIWGRKIAAFLHDPPDKAFWHEFREIDALRFWFWITNSYVPPFYFLKFKPVRKVRAWQKKCVGDKWNEIAEAISNTLYGTDKLREVLCDKPDGARSHFPPEILTNYFRRNFHNVASSQSRLHLFGFEKENVDIRQVALFHPLSGVYGLDVVKVTSEIDNNFTYKNLRDELADEIKNLFDFEDERIRFIALWRKRHWISMISPADTRIPDHPVIDLETIQSAIAATLMEETQTDSNGADDSGIIYKIHASFLILEFRPVQKFIENARKTRDLWFSSWLISYLAWQTMKQIANELGPDNIVYPDLYKQPLVDDWLISQGIEISDELKLRMPTLPNTFLAIVPEGKEEGFAKKSRKALKDAWDKIVGGVHELLADVGILERESPLEKEFRRQTEQLPFDIYWLGLKWRNDPEKAIEDYKSLFNPDDKWAFGKLWPHIKDKNPNVGDTYGLLVQMAQTGLKALKYRGKPQAVEEPGYKCTLCGERTVLTDGDPNDINGIKNFWKQMADAFPGHIKENEHLCAVCLVKRLAPKAIYQSVKKNAEKYKRTPFFDSIVKEFDYHYPSTGSIAIAPFIRDLLSLKNHDEIKRAIEKLNDTLSGLPDNFKDAHFTEGRTVPTLGRIIDGRKDEGDFEPEWFYDEAFQRFYDELEHQKSQDSESQNEFKQKRQWAEQIEQAVNQIKNIAKEKLGDKYHLPKYYAAVYLDGDNLGKWLSGEKAPKIEEVFHPDFVRAVSNDTNYQDIKDLKRPVTPAIHRAISSALRDFALEVVPYVVEHNLGVVVYSGGDDTLILMPLENLLDTIITLRKLYSGERYSYTTDSRKFDSDKGFIKIYEKDGNGYRLKEIIRIMGTKATLSAGVAIAHYLDPLDITLSKARETLKAAKNKDDKKNKAGFKLMLHSGNETEAVVPWKFVEAMKKFKRAVENGFSSRFLRTLYGEVEVFNSLEGAFDAEFFKFGMRGQPDSEEAELLLCDLIDAREQNKLTPKEFLEALLITDFLVREEGSK